MKSLSHYLALTTFFFLGAVTLVTTVSDGSSGGGPSTTVSMVASSSESSTKVDAVRVGSWVFFLVLSIHIPSTGFSMSPTMAWAMRRVRPKPLPPEIQMPPLLTKAATEPLRAKNLSWTSRLANPSSSYAS